MLKNLLSRCLLITIISLTVISCQEDEFGDSETSDEIQPVQISKVSIEELFDAEKVKLKIDSIGLKLDIAVPGISKINSSIANSFIDESEILFMEYDSTHTYTFRLFRPESDFKIENIVLHYNLKTLEYDEYLVQYQMSTEQYLNVLNGESRGDESQAFITQLSKGSVEELLTKDFCTTTCVTIDVNCTAGGNHSFGESCSGDASQRPQRYEFCGSPTCYTTGPPDATISDAPDSGHNGGGGTGGDVRTIPVPLEPCENTINSFSDGSGQCVDLTEYALEQILIDNPFFLLDMDCSQIENWQSLAQHVASPDILRKINQLPSDLFNDFEIQELDEAEGVVVNLDYFSVNVEVLPEKDPSSNTNERYTPEELLEYFRSNINDFVDGSEFQPYEYESPTTFDESAIWNSDDPTGSIIYITIPLDDGVVVTSEYSPNSWRFMTMNAPIAGNHPVSGTREFGFESNTDGSYTFYTRGVDRFADSTFENIANIFAGEDGFEGANDVWRSFQTNFENFVNDNEGRSTSNPAITEHPDWDKVNSVLRGESPISDLGCD